MKLYERIIKLTELKHEILRNSSLFTDYFTSQTSTTRANRL